MKQLRDFQLKAIERVNLDKAAGYVRIALELPTGSGKSVIAAEFMRRVLEEVPSAKVLFLVHRFEIIDAEAKTARAQCPGATVGVITGSTPLKDRLTEASCSLVMVSTGTLSAMDEDSPILVELRSGLHTVIYDEGHRVGTSSGEKCLHLLGVLGSEMPPTLIGLSATLKRSDAKQVVCDHVDPKSCEVCPFQRVAFRQDIVDLIAAGHLSDMKFMSCMVDGLDLSKVKSTRVDGELEFSTTSLDAALRAARVYETAATFISMHAADRKTLIFTPSVRAAQEVVDCLIVQGLRSAVVAGSMKRSQREDILRRIQLPPEDPDALDAVAQCLIWSEGTDIPAISCVVSLRPMRSVIFFKQALGRGMRLHAGKSDCLVIDLAGTLSSHRLASAIDLDESVANSGAAKAAISAGASLVKAKAAAAQESEHDAALNEEIQKLLDPYELGSEDFNVTGSFNLFEVPVWSPETRAKVAQAHVDGVRKTREAAIRAAHTPRPFPAPPRFGIFIDCSDTQDILERALFPRLISLVKPEKHTMLLLPLEDYRQGNRLDGSFVVVASIGDQFFVFSYRKDRDEFDFINPRGAACPVESPEHVPKFDTVEDCERAVVAYAQTVYTPETWAYVINPASKRRRATASPELIKAASRLGVMRDMLTKISSYGQNTSKLYELALPRTGAMQDWIALKGCESSARKNVNAMRTWLNGTE